MEWFKKKKERERETEKRQKGAVHTFVNETFWQEA